MTYLLILMEYTCLRWPQSAGQARGFLPASLDLEGHGWPVGDLHPPQLWNLEPGVDATVELGVGKESSLSSHGGSLTNYSARSLSFLLPEEPFQGQVCHFSD